MKILQQGDPLARTWWHGRRLKCEACNQVVQLEAGDQNHPQFMHADASSASIGCSNCQTRIIEIREK